MNIIANNALQSVDEINSMIFCSVMAFVESSTFADDMTCVLVAIRDHETGKHGETATLVTTSALGELAGIRAFVAEFCTHSAVPHLADDPTAALTLAVNEAAANIMKHAYAGSPGGRIEISASDQGDHVVIRLCHGGENFRRSDVAAPQFDGTAEGGFGIFIIEQSVDEVSYGTDAQGAHEIVLTKYKTTQEGEDPWNCTVKL